DEQEIGRNHKDTLGLVGDARTTLEALLERLRAAAAPRTSRKAEHEALRARMAAENTMEPNASIIKSLRAGAPENTILVAGMTQIGYYSRPFWPVYEPRTYLSSSYSGNLGYAYPVALGAKVARPDTASTWSRWSSTTAPTATWPATSTSPGAGSTGPSCRIPTS